MKSAWFNKHKIMKKAISILTLGVFICNFVLTDARAIMVDPSPASYPRQVEEFSQLDVETFTIPQDLGVVKYFGRGDPDKVVIHIQDAHCNYAAQKKISRIIEYLNKEYGIELVNLEGGTGDYDLSIFTGIYDRNIRKDVADHFMKWGEVNGAEFFAMNNPDKVRLWGVEDTGLYLKNLDVYQSSLSYKDEVDRYLKQLNHVLNNLKIHVFSKELFELDNKYGQYRAENIEFKDYMIYLLAKAKRQGINIRNFANIYLLSQSLEQEERINFKKANNERDALVARLQEILSRKELKELVSKTVSFKNKRISQNDFYDYLIRKAKQTRQDLEDFPELRKYIIYISLYNAVDKTRIMQEIESLDNQIKETIYANDKQRELDRLSKNLILTMDIFDISFTRNDYRYYQKNRSAFDVRNYISFINKEAPLYGIAAKLDKNITRLDLYRGKILEFYEYSFRRDACFLENMKLAGDKVRSGIFITGGFHTENLLEKFKENNISYVSIIPNFKDKEGYECPYFDILSGGMSPLEKSIKAALSSMQVASLCNKLGVEASDPERAELFRIGVLALRSMYEAGKPQAVALEDGGFIVFSTENGNPVCRLQNTLEEGAELVTEEKFGRNAVSLVAAFSEVAQDRIIREAKRDYLGPDSEVVRKVMDNLPEGSVLKEALRDLLDREGYFNEEHKWETPRGYKGVQAVEGLLAAHAGQAIYLSGLSESADPDEQAAQLMHELTTGIYAGTDELNSHGLASAVEEAFRNGDYDRMRELLSTAIRHSVVRDGKTYDVAVWDMTLEERRALETRDYAEVLVAERKRREPVKVVEAKHVFEKPYFNPRLFSKAVELTGKSISNAVEAGKATIVYHGDLDGYASAAQLALVLRTMAERSGKSIDIDFKILNTTDKELTKKLTRDGEISPVIFFLDQATPYFKNISPLQELKRMRTKEEKPVDVLIIDHHFNKDFGKVNKALGNIMISPEQLLGSEIPGNLYPASKLTRDLLSEIIKGDRALRGDEALMKKINLFAKLGTLADIRAYEEWFSNEETKKLIKTTNLLDAIAQTGKINKKGEVIEEGRELIDILLFGEIDSLESIEENKRIREMVEKIDIEETEKRYLDASEDRPFVSNLDFSGDGELILDETYDTAALSANRLTQRDEFDYMGYGPKVAGRPVMFFKWDRKTGKVSLSLRYDGKYSQKGRFGKRGLNIGTMLKELFDGGGNPFAGGVKGGISIGGVKEFKTKPKAFEAARKTYAKIEAYFDTFVDKVEKPVHEEAVDSDAMLMKYIKKAFGRKSKVVADYLKGWTVGVIETVKGQDSAVVDIRNKKLYLTESARAAARVSPQIIPALILDQAMQDEMLPAKLKAGFIDRLLGRNAVTRLLRGRDVNVEDIEGAIRGADGTKEGDEGLRDMLVKTARVWVAFADGIAGNAREKAFGSNIMDRLSPEAREKLLKFARENNIFAYSFGRDEFALILPEWWTQEMVEDFLLKMQAELQKGSNYVVYDASALAETEGKTKKQKDKDEGNLITFLATVDEDAAKAGEEAVSDIGFGFARIAVSGKVAARLDRKGWERLRKKSPPILVAVGAVRAARTSLGNVSGAAALKAAEEIAGQKWREDEVREMYEKQPAEIAEIWEKLSSGEREVITERALDKISWKEREKLRKSGRDMENRQKVLYGLPGTNKEIVRVDGKVDFARHPAVSGRKMILGKGDWEARRLKMKKGLAKNLGARFAEAEARAKAKAIAARVRADAVLVRASRDNATPEDKAKAVAAEINAEKAKREAEKEHQIVDDYTSYNADDLEDLLTEILMMSPKERGALSAEERRLMIRGPPCDFFTILINKNGEVNVVNVDMMCHADIKGLSPEIKRKIEEELGAILVTAGRRRDSAIDSRGKIVRMFPFKSLNSYISHELADEYILAVSIVLSDAFIKMFESGLYGGKNNIDKEGIMEAIRMAAENANKSIDTEKFKKATGKERVNIALEAHLIPAEKIVPQEGAERREAEAILRRMDTMSAVRDPKIVLKDGDVSYTDAGELAARGRTYSEENFLKHRYEIEYAKQEKAEAERGYKEITQKDRLAAIALSRARRKLEARKLAVRKTGRLLNAGRLAIPVARILLAVPLVFLSTGIWAAIGVVGAYLHVGNIAVNREKRLAGKTFDQLFRKYSFGKIKKPEAMEKRALEDSEQRRKIRELAEKKDKVVKDLIDSKVLTRGEAAAFVVSVFETAGSLEEIGTRLDYIDNTTNAVERMGIYGETEKKEYLENIFRIADFRHFIAVGSEVSPRKRETDTERLRKLAAFNRIFSVFRPNMTNAHEVKEIVDVLLEKKNRPLVDAFGEAKEEHVEFLSNIVPDSEKFLILSNMIKYYGKYGEDMGKKIDAKEILSVDEYLSNTNSTYIRHGRPGLAVQTANSKEEVFEALLGENIEKLKKKYVYVNRLLGSKSVDLEKLKNRVAVLAILGINVYGGKGVKLLDRRTGALTEEETKGLVKRLIFTDNEIGLLRQTGALVEKKDLPEKRETTLIGKVIRMEALNVTYKLHEKDRLKVNISNLGTGYDKLEKKARMRAGISEEAPEEDKAAVITAEVKKERPLLKEEERIGRLVEGGEIEVVEGVEVRAGLIGKLYGRDGQLLKEGFTAEEKDGKLVISHSEMDSPVTLDLAARQNIDETRIIKLLDEFLSDKRSTTLTDEEKEKIRSLRNTLKDMLNFSDKIVILEANENILGHFGSNRVLYLNENLIGNPLALFHELGEGNINLPEGYAITRHTYMRGVGEDVREAYYALVADGIDMDRMTAEEFTGVLKKKMEDMGLRDMTESERELVRYNSEQADRKGIRKKLLLFGLQDHLDPSGNLALTRDIRGLVDGLRRGCLNIVLIPGSNVETIAGQEKYARKTSRKFRKHGINTRVSHFDTDLEEKLQKTIDEAIMEKNKKLLTKIFVYCLTERDKAIAERFQKEHPNLIIIGNDISEEMDVEEIQVDETRVIAIGSILLNDKRLREDFGMSPQDLVESRIDILGTLNNSGIIDENLEGMTAEGLEGIMQKLYAGDIALRITRVNWEEIEDWQNAQEEILRSL